MYKEKEFRATGTHHLSADLKFYELIRILGNTIAKVIGLNEFKGWSKSNQELVKFESLKWSDSYIIQLCDVLANFFFNHIRYLAGKTEKKYELKSKALSTRINLEKLESRIKTGFEIKDGDITSSNGYILLTADVN